MNRLWVTAEDIRNARPESVANLGQLVAGQVVIGFDVYHDMEGKVNEHYDRLAVVCGAAYRIRDGELIDKEFLGKQMRADPLPAYTREQQTEQPRHDDGDSTWLYLDSMGIAGVDRRDPPAGISRGLLLVREESYLTEISLEVGPGLYVNGANDYQFLAGHFMAIALDSNPRLAGAL